MGRYDALTQLEETSQKPTPSPAVSPTKPSKKKVSTPQPNTIPPRHQVTTTPPITNQLEREAASAPQASRLESKPDRLHASNHASTLAISPETIEAVRKVVKNPGKEEVLYVRVSKEEKDTLDDISYTYKRQGTKTSDNEIVRVAINTLLEDYKIHGANSLLAILLKSLHD
jgi:hypothetical protein